MTQRVTNRSKLLVGAAVLALSLTIGATPTGRNVAVAALVDFAEITEKVARFPC
jgi:hypothetical protein